MASVVVGWKVCPRQFVFPQQYLLRLTRTVSGVHLSNIECQMSNIKLTSRTSHHVHETFKVFVARLRPIFVQHVGQCFDVRTEGYMRGS